MWKGQPVTLTLEPLANNFLLLSLDNLRQGPEALRFTRGEDDVEVFRGGGWGGKMNGDIMLLLFCGEVFFDCVLKSARGVVENSGLWVDGTQRLTPVPSATSPSLRVVSLLTA